MTAREKGQRFLLYGMYGAVNVGDELVCYAVAKGLRQALNQPRICVASINKNLSKQFSPLQDLEYFEGGHFHYKFWLRFFKVVGCVRAMDGIVIGGGGLLQDQYSWRLPAGSAFMTALGLLMDKPTFIVGAGVGPIKRRWLKKAISWILPYVTQICVRDEQSGETLRELGVLRNDVAVTADVVPSIDIGSRELACDVSYGQNLVALVLRDWPGLDYESLAKLMDELALKGYRIHLHCFEPLSDSKFYNRVLSFCKSDTLKVTEKIIPDNLQKVVQTIKKATVVISMRLHGCILAIGADVPLLPVVYERKVGAFIEQMKLAGWLKDVKELRPDMLEDIESMREYWEQHRQEIRRQYNKIRRNSVRNFELLREKFDAWQWRPLGWTNRCRIIMGLATLLLFGFVGEVIHLMSWPFKRLKKAVLLIFE